MLKQPTAAEIQATKLYQQWGLSDDEYELIRTKILKRLPNYTETGLFSVMWSEHCSYKNSKPVLKKFPTSGQHVLQGPGEALGFWILAMVKQWSLKLKAITIPQQSNPMKGRPPVSAVLFGIFFRWARRRLRF